MDCINILSTKHHNNDDDDDDDDDDNDDNIDEGHGWAGVGTWN